MTWEIFYLACFLFGVTMTALVVPGRKPAPAARPLAFAPRRPARRRSSRRRLSGSDMPFFNFATIMAFLAWFGGAGYLLTRYSSLVVTGVLVLAVVAGVVGAAIVFWFVAKVLLKYDRDLDPADYERVGVLGRISSPIRAGGTGEIIFSQEGTRQHLRRAQRERRSPAARQ